MLKFVQEKENKLIKPKNHENDKVHLNQTKKEIENENYIMNDQHKHTYQKNLNNFLEKYVSTLFREQQSIFQQQETAKKLSKIIFFLVLPLLCAKKITELEYFIGQTITIANSSHPATHLSYSEKDSSFMFANSNVSPVMFSYRDDAQLTCSNGDSSSDKKDSSNCTTFKISVAEKDLCSSSSTIIPCKGTPTLWTVEKKQFGFIIKDGDMCLTKDDSTAPALTKCASNSAQQFDFALSLACTDPQHSNLPQTMKQPVTNPLGSNGPNNVESIVRSVVQSLTCGNGGVDPQHMAQYHGGMVQVPMQMGYPQIEPHLSYSDPHFYDPGHYNRGNSYLVDDPQPRKFIHTDPLHQRIRKVKPAVTSVETKTVPVKMRVETREEPTVVSVDRRMVKVEEEIANSDDNDDDDGKEEGSDSSE